VNLGYSILGLEGSIEIVTLFSGRISVPILRFTAIFDRLEPTRSPWLCMGTTLSQESTRFVSQSERTQRTFNFLERDMKELLKQHLGSIVLAAAILLAVIIHALTTRYVPVKHDVYMDIVDRWTGKVVSP
jgi:hypothetical protein